MSLLRDEPLYLTLHFTVPPFPISWYIIDRGYLYENLPHIVSFRAS